MALVTENGTGLADAESYISVADATAYHAARANAAWAAVADDATREAYLRRATDFMEQVYRERWAGYRVTATQALSWPRYEVPMKDAPGGYRMASYYRFDVVPLLVSHVCALLALRAIAGDLTSDVAASVKKKKVGPIEMEYYQSIMPVRSITAINEMLRPLLRGDDLNIKVVRA